MSASSGMSESKNTSHASENGDQSTVGSQTPNNLPYLQAGWNQAANVLGATQDQTPGLANEGEALTSAATPLAAGTAVAGANTAAGFANGTLGGNSANADLQPMASGAFVNSNNPAFQNVVNQTALALQPQIDGSMAAAGRYGSGANANAFDTALTNATGQMAYQNYTQQQANQLAAAGQLSQNNATIAGQQLQGASLTPGVTTNLYAPATASLTASEAPLLAYFQQLGMGGSGGGVQSGNTYNVGTQNGQTIGLNHFDQGGVNLNGMMGG